MKKDTTIISNQRFDKLYEMMCSGNELDVELAVGIYIAFSYEERIEFHKVVNNKNSFSGTDIMIERYKDYIKQGL